MRSRLFSALSGHPNLEVNRRPEYRENLAIFGGQSVINIAGFLRILHDTPLEEIGKKAIHPLCLDIRRHVAEEMAARRAMGEEPDLQDVLNDVCDLSGLLRAVDANVAGKRVDLADVIQASLARRAAS
jgi:hypothetical protein